jgi:hypothetical protein
MSKVSSNYPAYNSTSLAIGDSSATTGVNGGVLNANYNMGANESAIYNYALTTLASILPRLNTFSADTQNSLQASVDAYRNSGLNSINKIYNPMIQSLQNDIVSRFGNLDNSIFSNNLQNIESERANAISSFAQDVLAKQNSLKADELTQRYALVNLLNGVANNTYNNALNAISTALGGSANINNYNSSLYNALKDISSTNSNLNNNSLFTTLLGLIGNSDYPSLPSIL